MAKNKQTLDKVRINGIDYQIGQRWFDTGTLSTVIANAYNDTSFQKEIAFADTTDYGTIALIAQRLIYNENSIEVGQNFTFIANGNLHKAVYDTRETNPLTLEQGVVLVVDVDSYTTNTLTMQNAFKFFTASEVIYKVRFLLGARPETMRIRLDESTVSGGYYVTLKVYDESYQKIWEVPSTGYGPTTLVNTFMTAVRENLDWYIDAEKVPFDNASSGLDATNVQEAIDEIVEGHLVLKRENLSTESTGTYIKCSGPYENTLEVGKQYTVELKDVNFDLAGGKYPTSAILCYDSSWTPTTFHYPYRFAIENGMTFIVPENTVNVAVVLDYYSSTEATRRISFSYIIRKGLELNDNNYNPNIPLDKEVVKIKNTNFIEDNLWYYNEYLEVQPDDATLIETDQYLLFFKPLNEGEIFTIDIPRMITIGGTDNEPSSYNVRFYGGDRMSLIGNYINYYYKGRNQIIAPTGTKAVAVYLQITYNKPHAYYGIKAYKGTIAPYNMNYIITQEKKDYLQFKLPILYIDGDISQMVNGETSTTSYKYVDKEGLERTGTCTIKWQGSSSKNYYKKNYTVKFDNAFEAKEGWGEQTKYCMKANWVDFSHLRNNMSCNLWGKVIKNDNTVAIPQLKTCPNGGAIDGFPCVIVMNGQYLGLYTFNIPKDGWMMKMGNGTKEAIVCAYLTANWRTAPQINTNFDLEYNSDTFSESEINASLLNIYNALNSSSLTAENIDATLGQYLDIDMTLRYMVVNGLCVGGDNEVHNYLLGTYDGIKWFPVPYDMDCTFGNSQQQYYALHLYPCLQGNANALFRKLADLIPERLYNMYQTIRNNWLRDDKVWYDMYIYSLDIPKRALDIEVELYPDIPKTSSSNLAQIIQYYVLNSKYCDEYVDEHYKPEE